MLFLESFFLMPATRFVVAIRWGIVFVRERALNSFFKSSRPFVFKLIAVNSLWLLRLCNYRCLKTNAGKLIPTFISKEIIFELRTLNITLI